MISWLRNRARTAAVNYLRRRGCVVLLPGFAGMVLGRGIAKRREVCEGDELWEVVLYHNAPVIAVNQSIVDYRTHLKHAEKCA